MHLLSRTTRSFTMCIQMCVNVCVLLLTGLDTMRWLVCAAPGQMLRVLDGITGTKCWLTHASPSHTGTLWERYRHFFAPSLKDRIFTELSRSSWMWHWPEQMLCCAGQSNNTSDCQIFWGWSQIRLVELLPSFTLWRLHYFWFSYLNNKIKQCPCIYFEY